MSHSNFLTYAPEYAELQHKEAFFEQITIDTISEFDQMYEKFGTTESVIYRGQREAKWRLFSSLQRFWRSQELQAQGYTYKELLVAMINAGRLRYGETIKLFMGTDGNHIFNDIAVLGFLQHHGCPTPMLDWTFRLSHALFFAFDNVTSAEASPGISNYASVYYLEEEFFESGGERALINEILPDLNEEILHYIIEHVADSASLEKAMRAHFKGREILDRRQFETSGFIAHGLRLDRMMNIPITFFSERNTETGIAFSIKNSQNIVIQDGVFTWSADSSKPLEVIGAEEFYSANPDKHSDVYRFCKCFNIHKGLASEIKDRLENLGINRSTMYPNKGISAWDVFEDSKRQAKLRNV